MLSYRSQVALVAYKSLGYLYVKETGFAIGRWYDFFRIFTRAATKYLGKMY